MFPFQKIKLSDALFFRDATFEVSRASFADLQTPRKGGGGKQKRPQFESCGALIQKAKQEQQTQKQISTQKAERQQVGYGVSLARDMTG
jgi:hypothetical protein